MIRQVINGVYFLFTGCHSSRAQVHPAAGSSFVHVNLSPGGMYGEMYYPEEQSDVEAVSGSMGEWLSSPEEEGKIKAEQGSPEINEISSDSCYFRKREAFVLSDDEDGELTEPGLDEIGGGLRAADFVLPDGSNVFYAPNASGPGVPRCGIGRQDADDVFADSSDEESWQESVVEQGGYRSRLQTMDDVNADLIDLEGIVNGMVLRGTFRVNAQNFSSDDGLSSGGGSYISDDSSVNSVCTGDLEAMQLGDS